MRKWFKYSPADFLAFLRRDGSWRTANCPRAGWYKDFLDISEGYLRPALDSLCHSGSKVLQEETSQRVVNLLKQMGSDARICLDSNQHGAFL